MTKVVSGQLNTIKWFAVNIHDKKLHGSGVHALLNRIDTVCGAKRSDNGDYHRIVVEYSHDPTKITCKHCLRRQWVRRKVNLFKSYLLG